MNNTLNYKGFFASVNFSEEDNILFGKIGFELGKEKLSFGANFMLPITQNLTGGNVEANYRWSLNFNYSL